MSGPAADNDAERSHEPTPSRLEKARNDGDVAQSREANAAAAWLAAYAAILFGAPFAIASLAKALFAFLTHPEDIGAAILSDGSDGGAGGLLLDSAIPALIFVLPAAAAVVAALVAQQAIVLAPKKLSLRLSRISPAANARQKFGPDGLFEFAKGAAKLLAIMALFGFAFTAEFGDLPALALLAPQAVADLLLREAALFIGLIALFSVAVAAIDLPVVRAQHLKKLRMTFEEVRREAKESEGDPYMKQSRRERGKAIATNRMLRDVPSATVIIVNPTHYAVALVWSRETKGAPVCVAKGQDELAKRMREIAAANGVPIRRDPPAARAIYATAKVGREIDRAHFAAVAAAIHFAEAIRRKARA